MCHLMILPTPAPSQHQVCVIHYIQLIIRSVIHCTYTVKPGTHWRQSRQDVQHLGDQVGHSVDRDKLSNLSCCRFVAKTASWLYQQQSRQFRQQLTLLPICRRFRQQLTFGQVDRVECHFVAVCTGLYGASTWMWIVCIMASDS